MYFHWKTEQLFETKIQKIFCVKTLFQKHFCTKKKFPFFVFTQEIPYLFGLQNSKKHFSTKQILQKVFFRKQYFFEFFVPKK